MTLFEYDDRVRAEGYPVVCGIDEAGRGPLAGRVYAAAVVLEPDFFHPLLNDSKKLSEKKRDLLEPVIREHAQYAVAYAEPEEIDELNILWASMLAMRRAAQQLAVKADLYLIDGNTHPRIPAVCRPIVKGDATSAAVAAASILAKVSRDRYMTEMAVRYPQYGFERHKGYPVKAHYAAIEQYGLCEIHRRSFFKKHAPGAARENRGRDGEQQAADFLQATGYEIWERNYRTREGEIDIVACNGTRVALVEVKQRARDSIAPPSAFVTPSKQKKLILAAQQWLTEHPTLLPVCFDVIEVWDGQISHIKNAFSC